MAQSIINTSHLIITSPTQARDACEIHYGTTLTNIMINNHWQSATSASTHTHTHTHTHTFQIRRRDRRSKLWNTSSPRLCPHLILEVSKQRRLPPFNDKRSPESGAKWKFADPFHKGIPNLSEYSPIPRCREFGGENTAAATVPPSTQSISINAAGCLTCTRNTARLNALAYHFPRSLPHLFRTKCSLPCSLPWRKRRRKRLRVQSWDHWQLDVTKVNWNNRFLCVYILNGPLASAVLGSPHTGKLGSTAAAVGLRWKCEADTHTHTHTHTHTLTHTYSLTVMSRLC